MKVIFLDFDGVLNSVQYMENRVRVAKKDHPSLSLEWWAAGIDPGAVERINKIVQRTGAKIVISSSWRIGFPTLGLAMILAMRGLEDLDVVVDMTPRIYGHYRSDEIEAWLSEHPEVTNYVILDDDNDADIEGHFIQTDYQFGLTDADVEMAVKILG